VQRMVASTKYRTEVNAFKVNCGAKDGSGDSFGQQYWEKSGWIAGQDPFGWFQW